MTRLQELTSLLPLRCAARCWQIYLPCCDLPPSAAPFRPCRPRNPTAALRRFPPAALAAIPDPTANIFIEKGVETGAELLQRLERLQPLLRSRRPGGRRVRLLVVDSIAHVFRDVDGGGVEELLGRTELLFRVAALLRCAGAAGLAPPGGAAVLLRE